MSFRAIRRAAYWVQAGGVVAYPSEYVYGLGCDPLQEPAVQRILRLKHRAPHKGFIVIAASLDQLHDYVVLPDGEMRVKILASWPGPVTWILPCKHGLPDYLTGARPSLAVRVTAHPAARRLCELTGPLLSTSANRSGLAPARSMVSTRRLFGRNLDSIVPGNVQFLGSGTRIVDGRTEQIVRE